MSADVPGGRRRKDPPAHVSIEGLRSQEPARTWPGSSEGRPAVSDPEPGVVVLAPLDDASPEAAALEEQRLEVYVHVDLRRERMLANLCHIAGRPIAEFEASEERNMLSLFHRVIVYRHRELPIELREDWRRTIDRGWRIEFTIVAEASPALPAMEPEPVPPSYRPPDIFELQQRLRTHYREQMEAKPLQRKLTVLELLVIDAGSDRAKLLAAINGAANAAMREGEPLDTVVDFARDCLFALVAAKAPPRGILG